MPVTLGYVRLFSFFMVLLSRISQASTPVGHVILLYLWMVSGFGGEINPWSVLQAVPLMNQAHVQSREYIVVLVPLLILVGYAAQTIKSTPLRALIIGALMVEALVVRNLPPYSAYSRWPRQPLPALMDRQSIQQPLLILRHSITQPLFMQPCNVMSLRLRGPRFVRLVILIMQAKFLQKIV